MDAVHADTENGEDPTGYRGLRIFLVEDDDDTRDVMATILECGGHQVRAVGSVQTALREFAPGASDVLLSDIGLPDGSGLDLMRELRKRGDVPYAIALSGFGSPGDRASSAAAGFQHHLVKPFDFDTLERLLGTVPRARP